LNLQQQDFFQYVAPDRVSKKRPAGRFVLSENQAKRQISGEAPPGIVKKATEHRVAWLLFSTHHSDAAIMLRLIFRNVFGMILTTGNVILIQKASWFCEANNQRLPELTEHCDFLR